MGLRTAFAAAALAALTATSAASAASARPDLGVGFLVDPPQITQAGTMFSTAFVIENDGRSRAPRSRAAVFLSRDTRRDASDVRLASVRVPSIRRGRDVLRGVRLLVPRDTASGSYFLVVCADAPRRVRESDERHNCLGSATSAFVPPAEGPGR